MEIKGYTLHGDYYLADKVIPNKTWKEALRMKEEITLPNGKKVIAHTLSKKELETIPQEERECGKWYWTSISHDDIKAWFVDGIGGFLYHSILNSIDSGGARLSFHKNEIKQLLDIE